jgi:Peptidase MA superfamily
MRPVNHLTRLGVVTTAALGIFSCVSPLRALNLHRTLNVPATQLRLQFAEKTAADAMALESVLNEASTAAERFAKLSKPVTLSVVDSHQHLEAAVGRYGYPWLRAWAYAETIVVQAPSTWHEQGASRAEMVELLTHELTHCALFQQLGETQSRQVPLWFREGLATVTAGQGARYMTLFELADAVSAAGAKDYFQSDDTTAQRDFDATYAFAHHAVNFLLRRGDEARIKDLIVSMARGASFEAAFLSAMPFSLGAFQRNFVNYLRLRGFSGNGWPGAPTLPQ